MNERIKQLAEQAGITFDRTNDLVGEDSDLERFAELIQADEREACAKLCEKVANDYKYDKNQDGYDWPDGDACAEAIRAKK